MAVGASLIAASLALHRSAHPTVVGRWSLTYAIILAVAAAGATLAWISARRRGPQPLQWREGRPWIDLAATTYGIGYLYGSWLDPTTAGRVLDLEVMGFDAPPSIALAWLAGACVLVALAVGISRLPRKLVNVGVFVVAGLGACWVVEGVARGAAIIHPEVQGFPTARSRLWHRHHVRLNRMGFRDDDHAPAPAPGVRRLLVIGDSYAAGVGIEETADRAAERLAGGLEAATGTRWESIVAARSNTHTLQHLEFLAEALPLDPAAIILLYCFNDIENLRPPQGAWSRLTRHPAGLGELLDPARMVFVNSYAAQEAVARLRQMPRVLAARRSEDPYADSALVTRHLADLARFVERAKESGAVVLIIPFDVAVAGSALARGRYAGFMARLQAADLPAHSVADLFAGRQFESLTVNRLDGHPNERANALLAEALVPLVRSSVESGAPAPASP